jgi:hypothetical protein
MWPIVTCDNAVMAKVCRSKAFNVVRPIVTCDNAIIVAQVHGLRGFEMWPIVRQN